MTRSRIARLTKEFDTVVAAFAQSHNISIRDNNVRVQGGDVISINVVLAPVNQPLGPWVGRHAKLAQTEQVLNLLIAEGEPEAPVLTSLFEQGRLFMGTSAYLKDRAWAGRVVGRPAKTRLLEFDALYRDGMVHDAPPRLRVHPDIRRLLVPADSVVAERISPDDRVWVQWPDDGHLYRARVLALRGDDVKVEWVDSDNFEQAVVSKTDVLVRLA